MITLAARLGYGLTRMFDGVTKVGVRFNKGSVGIDTKDTEVGK